MGAERPMDPYLVLGITPAATDKAVSVAFHARARELHPDAHPGADETARDHYARAMAEVNDAYTRIREERRRAAGDAATAGEESNGESRNPWAKSSGDDGSDGGRTGRASGPWNDPDAEEFARRWHPPTASQCIVCGHEPVRIVRFEHVRAYVIRSTIETLQGPLCRSCGRAMGRSTQNATLVTGWWGVLAMFRNLYALCSNAVALSRLARLGAPELRDPFVVGIETHPMNEGRSVFARPGLYIAIAIFVAVGVMAAQSSRPRNGVDAGESVATVEWAVGSCVAENPSDASLVRPVACSETHAGEIVAVVLAGGDCSAAVASSSGFYVDQDSGRYCIDPSR